MNHHVRMFERNQIYRTQISVAVLMPESVWPTLAGPYPGSTDVFESGPERGVGYHLHEDESVLALLCLGGGQRVTFLLDPWSDSTRGLLCAAFEKEHFPLALAGIEDRFILLPRESQLWTDALSELDEHRQTHRRRHPREFIGAAFCADLIAYHAIHPNDAKRLANPIPGSASVTILLAPEHVAHLNS